MFSYIKNRYYGRYWSVNVGDTFAGESYALPERYYTQKAAHRAAARFTKKNRKESEELRDTAWVSGPFQA